MIINKNTARENKQNNFDKIFPLVPGHGEVEKIAIGNMSYEDLKRSYRELID